MLITQTPLRVSFFGGGTDMAGFYRQEGGCVLTAAIDKYIFVLIKRRFDSQVRVGYTSTELVDSAGQVRHELVREALLMTGVSQQVEINTMGDIPASGSGLVFEHGDGGRAQRPLPLPERPAAVGRAGAPGLPD